MRKYKRFNATPDAIEQYELGLADDGSFLWLITRSMSDAFGGSHHARGQWKQTDDTIAFEIAETSDGAPVPTTAVVQGDRLELAGFGVFA